MDKDLDKIGKRMPYTVPDGFFADMEKNILAEIHNKESNRKSLRKFLSLRFAIKTFTAAAAVVALIIVLNHDFNGSGKTDFTDVELAFNNLSSEDQVYMFEVYQDDIFLIEPNDENNVVMVNNDM